ncbi:adenosylcobinamide-phosphate synthase [Novosphingobium chloroacetimidivorans]|uniref:Cobalamin biosynthesis protein CobD n=1 Tax=Novosphingobium chloroacetimidivorans TaxID=1428314 RepID=A0A7W7KAX0_9SPHN|nr:adenosylcobinamide-phosphate synthase CbiB [Novosphingobium chloroacetimidivorans]MBB4858909.1 adenosylcobinamide-phosphate synthase [Novosphingobium chloroacetimidivorans]
MAEPIALVALAIDAALGWPARLYRRIGHPVGAFARVIGCLEKRWNKPGNSTRTRRLLGLASVAILVAFSAAAAMLLECGIRQLAGRWAWPLVALAAWPALAQRSLFDHYRPIEHALAHHDLPAARAAVSMIVGRDTAGLDEPGIARAAIESLAESFCDGVIAPLFWLLVVGLPGAWAYKAINTADSLIGHPEESLRAYGWAAARIDDVANLVPARLSGALICLAGAGGWRTLWGDHARHASPNAGWPEAAMAGALNVRLAGPLLYDDVLADKPWIGDGVEADLGAMRRARHIFVRACGLAWFATASIVAAPIVTGDVKWLP